jgi:pyrroline-5-carboxylate reductase
MAEPGIALIGCGNMGRSLAGGLVRAGWNQAGIIGIDPDAAQRERAAREAGIGTGTDASAAVAGAAVVILAVKPQMMRATVLGLAPALRAADPLVISVAAGIPVAAIQGWAGVPLAVVRTMPNTPALIGAGATGAWAGGQVSAARRELAERILGAVGIVQWVDREALLDEVTALSGCGPAYFFLLMEALMDAAVARGLTPEQARVLTLQTALGAARMAAGAQCSPAQLRRDVTSPGGTTERALRVLEQGGLRELVAHALEAAERRAGELARELGGD